MSQVSASTDRPIIELAGTITYPPELDWFFQGQFVEKGENVLLFGGAASGKYNMCKRIVAPHVMDRGKTAFMAVCAQYLYTNDIWAHPAPSAIPGVNPRMIDCDLLVLDGLPPADSPHHEKCAQLLALRTKEGRSTVVLITAWDVQPSVLEDRYPGQLEPRTWHVVAVPRPPMGEH